MLLLPLFKTFYFLALKIVPLSDEWEDDLAS